MSEFVCPFCGRSTSQEQNVFTSVDISFRDVVFHDHGSPHAKLKIYKCPNEACKKETLIAEGVGGYMENKTVNIYPEAIYHHFPDYVPEAIRSDYEEACLISSRSPKASATLARRCLQGMIRDFWQVTGKKNLYEEINAIKDKIPYTQWQAIDALRQLGNIGAHMERDVSCIVDVEPDEANSLLKLIELLIDKWYVARHDEEALLRSITEMADNKRELIS